MSKSREANIYKWLARYTPTKQRNPVEDRLSAAVGYLCGASPRFKKEFVEYIFAGQISRRQARRARVSMHPRYSLNVGAAGEANIPDLLITDAADPPQYVACIENKWDATPNPEQLDRYAALLSDNFADVANTKLVLLCREPGQDDIDKLAQKAEIIFWDRIFDELIYKNKNLPVVKPFCEYCSEELNMGTAFTGFPVFDEDNPYTTEKANGILEKIVKHPEVNRLLVHELCLKPVRALRGNWMAWGMNPETDHTRQIHVTLYVSQDHFGVAPTIPNAFRSSASGRRIIEAKSKGGKLLRELYRTRKGLGKSVDYWLWIGFRHARTRRDLAPDGLIHFKIDMLHRDKERAAAFETGAFKTYPLFWDFFEHAVTARNNNIEVGFEARLYTDPASSSYKERQSVSDTLLDTASPKIISTVKKMIAEQAKITKYLST